MPESTAADLGLRGAKPPPPFSPIPYPTSSPIAALPIRRFVSSVPNSINVSTQKYSKPSKILNKTVGKSLSSNEKEIRSVVNEVVTSLQWKEWELAVRKLWEVDSLEEEMKLRFLTIPETLKYGHSLGIKGKVSRSFTPENSNLDREREEVLDDYLRAEVEKGRMAGPFEKDTLEKVFGSPIRSSPLNVIPKSTSVGEEKKWRIIENSSFPKVPKGDVESINWNLNSDEYQCRWDKITDLRETFSILPPTAEVMGRDFKDGFHHIPVHPKSRPHLCLSRKGKIFVRKVAGFGVSTTPGIFGNLVDATLELLTLELSPRVKCHNQVDDWIVIRFEANVEKEEVLERVDNLGWLTHPVDKKGFDWTRSFRHIGIDWNLDEGTQTLPEEKRVKYLQRTKDLKASHGNQGFNLKEVESLVGSLQYVAQTRRDWRSFMRPLYPLRNAFSSDFERKKFLHQDQLEVINTWIDLLSLPLIQSSFISPPLLQDIDFSSDASNLGLGIVAGRFAEFFQLPENWNKESENNIGVAEAWAVEWLLEAAVKLGFRDKRIIFKCDNTGVIGAWEKGWCRNKKINDSIKRMCVVQQEHHIEVVLVYVESEENPADPVSRNVFGNLGYDKFIVEPKVPQCI